MRLKVEIFHIYKNISSSQCRHQKTEIVYYIVVLKVLMLSTLVYDKQFPGDVVVTLKYIIQKIPTLNLGVVISSQSRQNTYKTINFKEFNVTYKHSSVHSIP